MKLLTLNLILTALLVVSLNFSRTIAVEGILKPTERVKASWYGFESCVNPDCLMANGEVFDENEISCASRTHYGKILEISYKGKTITCPVFDKQSVNYMDRIDLSKRAFQELIGDLDQGIAEVIVYK